ncbi:MAG: biopolymer transporter ExbD [Cyclobacteriaceae bacterium]|nr:biopolymer transporter ExbD [Cyclobacteriaceae bacterium]
MARAGRKTPQVNSSSMADIAFLLLIFFLVTTTMATDKGLTLTLPPKADPNQPPPDVTKNQRNIFKVLVNSSDRILVEDEPLTDVRKIREMVKEFVLNFGSMTPEDAQLYSTLPESLRSVSLRSPSSSDNPTEAVISFKADRGTSYAVFLAILDELQGAYYEIYGAQVGMTAEQFRGLDRKKPDELEKYNRGREGFPMNISIADPTKIGGN